MIYDTLAASPKAPDTDRPAFTVNTAATEVVFNVGANTTLLRTPAFAPDEKYWLSPEDNFTILSYGIAFPWLFTMGSNPISFQLVWEDEHAIQGIFSELGGGLFGERLYCPFENAEFPLDLFIKFPNLANNPAPPTVGDRIKILAFTSTSNNGAISMIGAPAALNGQTYKVNPYIKIIHNLPLT